MRWMVPAHSGCFPIPSELIIISQTFAWTLRQANFRESRLNRPFKALRQFRQHAERLAVCGMLSKIAALPGISGMGVVGADLQIGRAIGRRMERYLRKSAADGLEQGLGAAAIIESDASVAG